MGDVCDCSDNSNVGSGESIDKSSGEDGDEEDVEIHLGLLGLGTTFNGNMI